MQNIKKRNQLKENRNRYGKRKKVRGEQRTVKKTDNRKRFSNFQFPNQFPISINPFLFPNFQTNFQFQLTPFFSLISKPISNFY